MGVKEVKGETVRKERGLINLEAYPLLDQRKYCGWISIVGQIDKGKETEKKREGD